MTDQAPLPTIEIPTRNMEVRKNGVKVGKISFTLKHGIWFWTHHDSCPELKGLHSFGDTEIAASWLCRSRQLEFVWLN